MPIFSSRKIVFLVSSLGPGGAERVASTLCNSWAARGDTVVLIPTFSKGGSPFYPLHSKVHVQYLANEVAANKLGKQYLRRLLLLRKMIRDHRPDLVVSFLPNVNVAAILATAFTGIPCIIGERSYPTSGELSLFWKFTCQIFYRYADVVTVQTNSVAQRIHHIYKGIQKISVIPNPLPPELEAMTSRNPMAQSIGGRYTLLYVGRLSAEKRVDRIIKAFIIISDKYPNWDLHILGDGALFKDLKNQVFLSALPDGRVRLLGRSNMPWKYMLESDAFVMASKHEGFPNALLEAVALGLPAVSTDCHSGPRDISDDGRVVRLVQNDDFDELVAALDRVLGSAELRAQLSREGAAFVRHRFALESVLTQWDALFQEVLDK
jgi:GalNAc-alpha-(1->4)-GalNAc-alpha-(1->3)-diNAcBac-PP-undecaprenol alpha-1,4-N-acetyl-D-galactosaminyltransferase